MNTLEEKSGYQVFEIGPTGGKHSITKVFPTWLGCKRVLNRIRRENKDLEGYRYVMSFVTFNKVRKGVYTNSKTLYIFNC